MKLKYMTISATNPQKQIDDVICYLCQEEIDPIFGYFYCFTCSIEMCRECAVHRNKNDMDIAENPLAVATNFEDIMDSASMTTKNLNASILKNQLGQSTSLQAVGERLVDPIRFQLELDNLPKPMTEEKFYQYSK